MTRKAFFWFVLLPAIIKLALSSFVELNNDEVYYWTYALKLQGNYFDHPPGIAILLKLFTFNLTFQAPVFLRLGPIVCGALSTVLIYRIGNRLGGVRSADLSALFFVSNPYSSIISGLFVMPDAPMLLFWLVAVDLMQGAYSLKSRQRERKIKLVLFGIFAGLTIMSKMHGWFLWLGLFLFLIQESRRTLISSAFLYGVSLTILIISPFLLWNIDNGFVSFKFHGPRVSGVGFHPDYWLRQVLGEFVYNNPILYILCFLTLALRFSRGNLAKDKLAYILLFFSIPLLALIWGISFFNETLPHWTGVSVVTLIPFVAQTLIRWTELEAPSQRKIKFLSKVRKFIIAYPVLFICVVLTALHFLPPMNSKSEKYLGKNDITLDMSGWTAFQKDLDSLIQSDLQLGKIIRPVFLISDNWFPAAHIDYYVARPANINFFAIGNLNSIHHYAWINRIKEKPSSGADAYFISISNYYSEPSDFLKSAFQSIEKPVIIPQYRAGKKVRHFYVYRLKNLRQNLVSIDGS